MKHLFENEAQLQIAREMLAHVEYLYLNRKRRSNFICNNLLDFYYSDISHDSCAAYDLMVAAVRKEIYPYNTVESFISHKENVRIEELHAEVVYQHRLAILAKLLKELE